MSTHNTITKSKNNTEIIYIKNKEKSALWRLKNSISTGVWHLCINVLFALSINYCHHFNNMISFLSREIVSYFIYSLHKSQTNNKTRKGLGKEQEEHALKPRSISEPLGVFFRCR